MKIGAKTTFLGCSDVVGEIKAGLLAVPFCLAVIAAPQALAQDEGSDDEEWMSANDHDLDDLVHKVQAEDDGDDDVPTRVRTTRAQSKVLTTYGAKEALRWKINKQAFFEGYFDQAVGTQDDPYRTPTSKFAGGFTGNYLWNGFALTGGFDIKRNYTDIYRDWDGILDKTYSLGASRKFKLSSDWSVTPSVKQSRLLSGTNTKELRKSDVSLPFSYALNKEWTLKALTVAYSTQTYTNRVEDQTDKTWTLATGVAYKWSAKSTFEVSIAREKRYSNQDSAEYTRTTILPKYEYKFSPTSSVGIAVGRETRSSSTQEFSRWILIPKLQVRMEF